MSFSAIVYLLSIVGAYKLGFVLCRDPEALSKWCKVLWAWMNK